MSYCRIGPDSDVYVYRDMEGEYNCCGCSLVPEGPVKFPHLAGIKYHLMCHRAMGHKVPSYAFDRIKEEMEE